MNKRILTILLAFLMISSAISPIYAVISVSSEDKKNEQLADKQEANSEAKRKEAFVKALKEENISEMVKHMTIEEKITQTFMMFFGGQTKNNENLLNEIGDIIGKYHFGAVIMFSGSLGNTKSAFQLIRDMQNAATTNNGIPLIIATDQEGGNVCHLDSGTALSGNMAIAATSDPANARKNGQIIGKELTSLGINTTLAPVMDINNNAQNPIIGVRSFGDTSEIVSAFGIAEIQGLSETGVINCAKHFPGHGNTSVDSHVGLPVINKTLDELKTLELIPFKKAINAGVDMIMTAHILYPKIDNTTILSEKTGRHENRPATMSKVIITDILKNPSELNFQGIVITDAMYMQGISNNFNPEQAVIESLKAGADMICRPLFKTYTNIKIQEIHEKIDKLIHSVRDSVMSKEENSLSIERLDDAVTRILTLKKKKGVLSYAPSKHTLKEAMVNVGNQQHRDSERILATKAVTVVKNNKNTLPFRVKNGARVLMVCPKQRFSTVSASILDPLAASTIMGWNRAKVAGLIPKSAKVRYYVFSEDDYQICGKLKAALDWADTVIVCSNVSCASDMMADFWGSSCPRNVTNYCYKKNKTSIVMSVQLPYDAQLYPNADAIVITYGYRGSKVNPDEAIAKAITKFDKACGPNVVAGIEVILGCFGASGKLPVEIPYFNLANGTFDPSNIVYQRGYGLSYNALTTQKSKKSN